MTEEEFEVLDELYFVKTYKQLIKIFSEESFNLDTVLISMLHKGWIKVLNEEDNEIQLEEQNLQFEIENRFLATKKGLIAHNQR